MELKGWVTAIRRHNDETVLVDMQFPAEQNPEVLSTHAGSLTMPVKVEQAAAMAFNKVYTVTIA